MTKPFTDKESPALSLAEAANVLIIKLRMECKQPHLADEVKSLFDNAFSAMKIGLNANQPASPVQHAKLCMDSLPQVEDVAKSIHDLKAIDESLYDCVINIISSSTAPQLPESDIDSSKDVDYRALKPAKGSWPLVQRDHNVLLALTRAYRFLVSAPESELQAYGHSRSTLSNKIRALEISAAIQGIEI